MKDKSECPRDQRFSPQPPARPSFERWRSGLELAIVRWLEQVHGTPYWIARDVAQDVVKSTKGLRALYRKGLTPSQAALDVASKLPQSELIKP